MKASLPRFRGEGGYLRRLALLILFLASLAFLAPFRPLDELTSFFLGGLLALAILTYFLARRAAFEFLAALLLFLLFSLAHFTATLPFVPFWLLMIGLTLTTLLVGYAILIELGKPEFVLAASLAFLLLELFLLLSFFPMHPLAKGFLATVLSVSFLVTVGLERRPLPIVVLAGVATTLVLATANWQIL